MKSPLFDDQDDDIIRDVYPLYGSPGVVALLPRFRPRQVNQRAHKLGVRVQPGRTHHIARAALRHEVPIDIVQPHRLRADDIYSDVERLAYARAWS